jgi:methylmalonyl-CoA mutase
LDDGAIPLASDFPAGDAAAWMALVEKTLDGQSFDKRLVARTYDGLKIDPLYTASNSAAPLVLPTTLREGGQWDIRVRVDHPDPLQANGIALEALEGGAHSVLLAIDPTGAAGIAIGSSADLDQVLKGVFIDLAPIALDAGAHGVAVAEWLLEIGEARTLKPRLALHIDPLSAFAVAGVAAGGIAAQIEAAAALAKTEVAETVFLASGQVVHEAGGGEAAELGFAMASALAYAKAAIDAGIAPTKAFGAIALGLPVDGEYFTTIAKLRAARALWARITEAATGATIPAKVEARSSRRMLATLDPWVNMLRITAAGFGAATGGADAVVLDAFSQPLGRPTAFARRQARNAQLVLMEETHLGAVADPAAGAWYLETLSRKLAEAAWAFMQKIEAAGGAVAALESGLVAEAVATTGAARAADIARRKAGLIGVSEFPDLAEAGVDLDLVDPRPFAKPAPPSLTGAESRCPPLTPHRSAEPFEALRRRAAAMDNQPKVFLATLGTPADYSGRTGFARNLFAAGGIAADVGEVNAYDPAEAQLAIVCSSDALYAEGAERAAEMLKAKGAKRIYLAGRPGDLQAALETAGVETFLYAGMDAVATLDEALTLLETGR